MTIIEMTRLSMICLLRLLNMNSTTQGAEVLSQKRIQGAIAPGHLSYGMVTNKRDCAGKCSLSYIPSVLQAREIEATR